MKSNKLLITFSALLVVIGILVLSAQIFGQIKYEMPLGAGMLSGGIGITASGLIGFLAAAGLQKLEAKLDQLANALPPEQGH